MFALSSVRKCILVFAIIFSTNAFNVTDDFQNGAFWPSFPIQMVKFATANIEDPLLVTLVQQAKLAWEAVVGKEIWSIPEDYVFTMTENNIRWSYNFGEETGFDPQSTLAITIRYRLGNTIDRAEIILNGNNPFLRANTNNMLYQTILHELGHVVGLGHSEYFNAIMAASLSGVNTLHQDDIDGINYVTDQTLVRQQNGGFNNNELSGNSTSALDSVATCGSIDLGNGGSGGGGPFSFLLTVMLGYLGTILVSRGKKIPNPFTL